MPPGQKKTERIWSKLSRHECEIDDTTEDFLHSLHPGSTTLTKWIHYLKRFTIVSSQNSYTKEYFRSMSALAKEKHRHAETPRYSNIIHPFSIFAQWRMVIMLVIYVFVSIMDPLYATFLASRMYKGKSYAAITVVQSLVNVLVMMNIAVEFFVGYPIPKTREVVLEPRLVAMRYLKTYFFFDLAAAMHSLLPLAASAQSAVFLRQLVLFRLVRAVTIREYFFGTLTLFRCSPALSESTGVIFMQMLVMHWWACYLSLIPTLCEIFNVDTKGSWLHSVEAHLGYDIQTRLSSHYLESLVFCTTHFFSVANHGYRTRCPYEMSYLSVVILVGMGFNTYAVAVMIQLYGTVNISESKYEDMIYQINEYSISKKLPATTRYRMAVYYEYKFQRKFFWEHAILNSISEHLRMEVMLYSAKHLVENVHLMKGLSRSAVGAIIAMLRQEVLLPGDKLRDSEDAKYEAMTYNFINYGTVAIYLHKNNVEYGHFEDGDHVGDCGVVFKREMKIQSYTVAIEISEVYTMSLRDMRYMITLYPEVGDTLVRILNIRKQHLLRVLDAESRTTHQDILSQLRHHKILEQGHRR